MAKVNIEERLQQISANVQESMRFAEAKNAALITFNGAALYVLVEGNVYLPAFIEKHWMLNAIVLIVGITLSIIAFLPSMGSSTKPPSKIKLSTWQSHKKMGIFYFGHIRKYGDEEFLARVYEFYDQELKDPVPRAELDLSHQAITLSRITRHKYVFFSLAGHLTLVALMLPIPLLLIYWFLVYLNKYTEIDLPV
jgi:hypothetical protein